MSREYNIMCRLNKYLFERRILAYLDHAQSEGFEIEEARSEQSISVADAREMLIREFQHMKRDDVRDQLLRLDRAYESAFWELLDCGEDTYATRQEYSKYEDIKGDVLRFLSIHELVNLK